MIRGSLDRLHFGDLLQWFQMGSVSGRLTLMDTRGRRRLDFRNGRFCYASSTIPEERLATWFAKRSLNMILAPLPPVLINAFGVSAYLAPIIEVDYWFAVQMIGVGQLIACYVLGLPLLLALEKRKVYFFN